MCDVSTYDAFVIAISWRAAATNNFRWLARTAKGSGTSSYCLAANLYATLINGPASDGVTAGMRVMASLRMFWGTGFDALYRVGRWRRFQRYKHRVRADRKSVE